MIVITITWAEDGLLRQDTFGPWEVADDDESHLAWIH